jgi:hypothetical protein
VANSTLVITRADAAFGQGHLARSLTLAAALRGEGAKVETLLLGDEGALQHARTRREPVVFFPSWELRYAMRRALLAQLLCELYPKQRPRLAIFDMYDFADTYWARRFFSEQLPDTTFVGLDIYKRVEQPQRPERSEYKPVAFSVIINSLPAACARSAGLITSFSRRSFRMRRNGRRRLIRLRPYPSCSAAACAMRATLRR